MKTLALLLSVAFLTSTAGCSEEAGGSSSEVEDSGAADSTRQAQPDSAALDLFGLEDSLGAGQKQLPGQPAPQNLPEGAVQQGSLANPQLVNEAVQRIAAVAAASMGCGEIENFLPYVAKMPKGRLGARSWRELWVFQGCGTEYPIEMSFSETAQGVEWSIEGEHAALQQPQQPPQPQPLPNGQQPEAMAPEQVAAQIGASFEMVDLCGIEATERMTNSRDLQRSLHVQSGLGGAAFDTAYEAGRQQVRSEWEAITEDQREMACQAVRRDVEAAENQEAS